MFSIDNIRSYFRIFHFAQKKFCLAQCKIMADLEYILAFYLFVACNFVPEMECNSMVQNTPRDTFVPGLNAIAPAFHFNLFASTTAPIPTECKPDELTPTSFAIKELYATQLEDYDRRIRPRDNQSKPVVVQTEFFLNSIMSLDVTNQVLSVRGYFYFKWYDEFLQWDPCENSGVTYLKFLVDEVWIPAVAVLNGIDDTKTIQDVSERILVFSNGNAEWVPAGIYNLFCEINIKFYPFEKQSCFFTVYVSDESANEVSLELSDESTLAHPDYFSENSEWELLRLYPRKQTKYGMSMVDIVFVTKRRPGFIIYTTVLPLTILTFMNMCTFLVPIESGEKGSISVTLFMAYGVILTFISSSLPNNSLDVSIFIIYGVGLMMFSLLTVIYTIIQARICAYHGDSVVGCFEICWSRRLSKIFPKQISIPKLRKSLTWKEFLRKIDLVLFTVSLVTHITSSLTLFLFMNASA